MARLGWFSPLAPVRSGIATYNRELLPFVADEHDIDVFVDGRPAHVVPPDPRVRLFDAHDFLWTHHRAPYDLVVYHLGNAPCHDYMWAYLTRIPGLVVLHDGQLHHARGRMLLQQWRPRQDDYRREFWFDHPDANPDLAELGAVGLLGSLTYLWPMLRAVVESSRHVVVHNGWLAEQIRDAHREVAVDVVEMGVAEARLRPGARAEIRSRHTIPEDAVVFAAFGKVTPEKRVREAMRALASIAESVPQAHLLVAGETVEYYDMRAEAAALGVSHRVAFAGYLPDEEIDDYLAASDVCLCMRWPTSRETSASWLRCLAAGKPTISTDLVHTGDVPTLDPRDWSVLSGLSAVARNDPASSGENQLRPVGVSIDILDEGHSLRLAMRRLATDARLRDALGSGARAIWAARFRLEDMAAAYQHAIARALHATTAGSGTAIRLPEHLRSSGAEYAESLVREILGSEYHLRDAD